jgi:hypothetical protein
VKETACGHKRFDDNQRLVIVNSRSSSIDKLERYWAFDEWYRKHRDGSRIVQLLSAKCPRCFDEQWKAIGYLLYILVRTGVPTR